MCRIAGKNTQIITFILIPVQGPQLSSQGPQRFEVLERDSVPQVCFSTCRKTNPMATPGVHHIRASGPPSWVALREASPAQPAQAGAVSAQWCTQTHLPLLLADCPDHGLISSVTPRSHATCHILCGRKTYMLTIMCSPGDVNRYLDRFYDLLRKIEL